MTLRTTRLKSPDGALELLIEVTEDESTIGFSGSSWHTHGDLIAEDGETPPEAAMRLAAQVLRDEVEIVIEKLGDGSRYVWLNLHDDPLSEHDDPAIVTRRWTS